MRYLNERVKNNNIDLDEFVNKILVVKELLKCTQIISDKETQNLIQKYTKNKPKMFGTKQKL